MRTRAAITITSWCLIRIRILQKHNKICSLPSPYQRIKAYKLKIQDTKKRFTRAFSDPLLSQLKVQISHINVGFQVLGSAIAFMKKRRMKPLVSPPGANSDTCHVMSLESATAGG